MSSITQIYVSLLDEGVDVWRPVQAEHVHGNVYRIIEQPYDSSIESWQFVPGDEVFCDVIEVHDGRILAAISKTKQSASHHESPI